MPKKTKKPNGAGGVRQRPDGKWEGRYSIGFDKDGKQIRRSVYGKTFKETNEKLNATLTALTNGNYVEPSKTSLVGWLQNWLETYAKMGIKSATYTSYETYINRHIAPYFGNSALQGLTPDALQKFVNYKTTGGRLDGKEGGISSKTIINIKNMIHAALKQAQINDLVTKNVALLIKTPKQTKVEMRVLNDEEYSSLLKTALGERSGAPIVLALFTGMRVGEVMALKLNDIDIDGDNPTLFVRSSLKRDYLNASHKNTDDVISFSEGSKTGIIRSSTKTYTSKRDIPLIQEAVELLKKQLALKKNEIRSAGSSYFNYGFIFSNEIGFPYDQRTYQDIFNKILKKAGIEKKIEIGLKDVSVGFHTLRHTFATRAIAAGMDILVLSKILGHAQPSTTLNKYGHVLPNHKRTSMEKIRSALNN
jgi:integrase